MYILNQDEQHKLLERLILIETLNGGWTKLYIDSNNNTKWLLFYHHGEIQGGGFPVLRENPPPNELTSWLRQCFSSGQDDDIRGLAWELSKEYEKWTDVLDWLENNSATLSTSHLKLFVNNLEILHVMNRRPIIGKITKDIELDYEFFISLTKRAKRLIHV